MARRGQAQVRKISPDAIYGNVTVSKFINSAMYSGKKSVSEKAVYKALEIVEEKTKKPALETFLEALEKVKPNMEVRPRRIGGAAYQVPMPVRGVRRESLAIRWLIDAARAKSNSEFHTFSEKLAAELIDVLNGEGGAMKKKTDMERMAEANRAFAHFRW